MLLKLRIMRYLLVIVCTLFIGLAQAQEKIEPKYERDGDRVKVTYYHSNGEIHQQGYFKDKKPEGLWAQFDTEGNMMSKGYYKQGKKEGKWLYYKGNTIKEVTYENNRIIDVTIREEKESVKIAAN